MITNEDNESSLLDFFTKIISHPPSCLESLPIKEEPLSEEDFKVMQKAGRKKQNHNISKEPDYKKGLPIQFGRLGYICDSITKSTPNFFQYS